VYFNPVSDREDVILPAGFAHARQFAAQRHIAEADAA